MKFFFTAEVDHSIGREFMELLLVIEKKLTKLVRTDYGESVKEIAIIPIVMNLTPEFEEAGFLKERVIFYKKRKEADVRLRIDFMTFAKSDNRAKELLIVKNIIDSINVLKRKVKEDFDASSLEKDILELLNVQKENLENI